ncbi:scaffolding protein [Serratia phage KSP90]|uniref:Scaffolding protein n=1 Tax=Serratia phage KSP90 TaxID=552528 RepID=B9A7C4_BPSK9|nr:scaffolding protein [Serratia phage KSP90]
MNKELKQLFEGVDGLNEEFMGKVATIIEARSEQVRLTAIQETEDRMNGEILKLTEAHQVELAQVKESAVDVLTAKVSSYLDAAVLEWANENAVGIDSTIKAEAAEKILSGAAQWFGEAAITVRGDADGVISGLTKRVEEAEKLAETLKAEKQALEEAETNRVREGVLLKVCEGLALSQIDTIRNCLEGVPMSEGFEARAARFRALVEKKDTPPEGDDKGDKDNKGKDKDDKGDKGDKDDKDLNEMDKSIKSQISQYLAS